MRYNIKDWPRPERPRERLRAAGPAALSTRELLAILVGSGPEGRTAMEVAGEVMRAGDGSLRRLAGTTPAELERVQGVGPAVAARLSAAFELGRRLAIEGPALRPHVLNAQDVYDCCAPSLAHLPQEELRVLLLNIHARLIREEVVTRGTLDGSLVDAREVFRRAIVGSAAQVILVHNHPSGDPTPSAPDLEITRSLAEAGRILGIPVRDHVIIGDASYVSFAETGLLSRD